MNTFKNARVWRELHVNWQLSYSISRLPGYSWVSGLPWGSLGSRKSLRSGGTLHALKKENHLTWYCCKVKGSNLIYTMMRGFMTHIPTTSPFEPVSPSTPGFPGRPGDPGGPGSPLAPGGPVIPISPLSPLKPESPWQKKICGYIWLIFIVLRGTWGL